MCNVNVNIYKNRIISRFTDRILQLKIPTSRSQINLSNCIFNFKIRPVNLELIQFSNARVLRQHRNHKIKNTTRKIYL